MRGQNHGGEGEARTNDWFAKQLGDGWETTGDGIYSHVGVKQGRTTVQAEPLDRALIDQIGQARGREQPVGSRQGLSLEEQRRQCAEAISAKLGPPKGESKGS